jgi:O-antigen/teichoic acid export membrane protein
VTTVLLIIVLGGLGPSVEGAIAVYLIVSVIQTLGFAVASARVTRAVPRPGVAPYGQLIRYGMQVYPGSLAGFFSYRVDAYLIAFLISNPSEAIGYYSMAVGLAEMIFLFPRAVSTMFFPQVAASSQEDSNHQVALVSRVTLLVSGAFAVLLVPAAAVMIVTVLPAFVPSLAPLLVLLPGVVALSAAGVVSGYLTGIGRPGITSVISLISLAVNVVANLVFIPEFGIIGASAASLVSYTLSALMLTAVAARLCGTPVAAFWIPRISDVRFVTSTVLSLLRRMRNVSGAVPGDHGA